MGRHGVRPEPCDSADDSRWVRSSKIHTASPAGSAPMSIGRKIRELLNLVIRVRPACHQNLVNRTVEPGHCIAR